MTKGVFVRKDDKRGSNRKGTDDVLTDGSVVHCRWWQNHRLHC